MGGRGRGGGEREDEVQHSKHNTTLYFEDKNNPVGLCFKPLSRTAFLLLIITLPLVVTAINPFTA